MTSKVNSREVGLVLGHNLFHFFLDTHDLHYGLWQDDLDVCLKNLPVAQRRLNPGGFILICDFFKTNAAGRSVIGGGHPVDEFMTLVQQSGLEVLENKNITCETAPNIDIADHMGRELLLPTLELIGYAFGQNYPWLAKLLRWKYRKKIRKIRKKYLGGERNAENFTRLKVYRLLLLRNS